MPILRSEKFGFVIVASLTLIAGCASGTLSSQRSGLQQPDEVLLSAEEVRTFNQNKERLDKLAALDADLTTLLTELSKHANVGEKPAHFRHQPTEQPITPSFSMVDDTKGEADQNKQVSSYTVVLGQFLNEQSAIAAAHDINEYFNILSLNMAYGVGISESKPGYYAVVLGNFSSKKIANLLCQAFAKNNQFCTAELNTYSQSYVVG